MTLDAQFRTVIQDGLNCSPFEAEAVFEAVKDVYGPYLNGSSDSLPPGAMRLVAGDADEPAGEPVLATRLECRAGGMHVELQPGSRGGIPGDRP